MIIQTIPYAPFALGALWCVAVLPCDLARVASAYRVMRADLARATCILEA